MPPNFLAFLISQNCYLDGLVMLEARGLCVKHVEVFTIEFLYCLLASLGVLILLLLHELWYQAESKTLLFA